MLLSKPILLVLVFLFFVHAAGSRSSRPPYSLTPADTPADKQGNISLEFSAAGLTGEFKTLLYAIDSKKSFSKLPGNVLKLEPGSGIHTVYVKTMDANDKESNAVLKISINTGTPFYKTSWFWSLTAVIATALLLGLYNRRKITRQRIAFRQQLALEQQRNKITSDLHDDIGASLSSLQVNSAVAGQLIHKDPEYAKKVLDKIETQFKSLSDKISDFIWSMKPGRDEFMTMSSRIKTFVNDILGATNIEYDIQIDKTVDTLVKDTATRKNIVLITKEAVNNAVKYSRAKKIIIMLCIQQKNIQLQVTDNGAGFSQSKKTGNGISNMRKRTEKLGGEFNISSVLHKGTTVYARIPLIP